jgi:hypothetical protein
MVAFEVVSHLFSKTYVEEADNFFTVIAWLGVTFDS